METGKVIRVFYHSDNTQVMCVNGQRILSVYFEHKHYNSFYKIIKNRHIELYGLLIKFDRNIVKIPVISERKEHYLH
jgi:hypothetical protein